MKHYTDTIPLPLAEKLKEKGMPIRIDYDTERTDATYSACFDWLMEKKIIINIEPYNADTNRNSIMFCWLLFHFKDGNHPCQKWHYETWHEAAEKAIEKALELI